MNLCKNSQKLFPKPDSDFAPPPPQSKISRLQETSYIYGLPGCTVSHLDSAILQVIIEDYTHHRSNMSSEQDYNSNMVS